ncbi:MAG: hypothetical protein WBN83_17230 [Desulfoprunum sp.]|uniref:hypothetical protein n=1 Tax=Desulfoprunum sp. TaxID=2020866 RepID=UPI00052DA4EA|nr:hypothetical protein JT06_09385 [Desulfobulbus sp. Tol-SR]
MDEHLPPPDDPRIDIGGIKFSPELVQYTCRQVSSADRSLSELLRQMAERRINLSFYCSGRDGELSRGTFCVAAADAVQVDRIFDGLSPDEAGANGQPWTGRVERITRIGTLTIFPHRRSPTLLGRVVASLAEAGIPIHSLCTSISALSVNIDFPLLDEAVAILGAVVDLPEHHSPFRPEFSITQIKR